MCPSRNVEVASQAALVNQMGFCHTTVRSAYCFTAIPMKAVICICAGWGLLVMLHYPCVLLEVFRRLCGQAPVFVCNVSHSFLCGLWCVIRKAWLDWDPARWRRVNPFSQLRCEVHIVTKIVFFKWHGSPFRFICIHATSESYSALFKVNGWFPPRLFSLSVLFIGIWRMPSCTIVSR